jgi:hypothetical protein
MWNVKRNQRECTKMVIKQTQKYVPKRHIFGHVQNVQNGCGLGI